VANNPYSPPTAPVADIPTDPLVKNDAVWTACMLLWLSFGISLISLIVDGVRAPAAGSVVAAMIGALVGGAIGLLITGWIVSKLKAGRNWMRLLLTICTALGYLTVVIFWGFYRDHVFPIYAKSPMSAVFAALQTFLGFCSVVLLNTPSARAWFASSQRGAGN
jgi:hypothetical protein